MKQFRLSDLKFGTKILLGFSVIILLFAANAFYTMTMLYLERDQLIQINAEYVPATDYSTKIQTHWLKSRYHIIRYAKGEGLDEAKTGQAHADSAHTLITQAMEMVQKPTLRKK
ncbi:hypothetical protein [Anaerophaga thermohalophila]|uniref:hypothetical protein n=1 Tax=Anaerophaga thermohalophila TaxID=177400 RepID=UPI0002E25859|nr:hypothetical protein [Anaerophaga thermohalophila]